MEAPPAVSAALYRAAARVHTGVRTEWIFDKRSLPLLGERTVILEDSAWGKSGKPVTTVAIVARGVTDRTGQKPQP